ncbi:wd repeat-containing protein pop1 [Anaeramoeba flamelloides]|uniref:Wd repeat-containing protein pop1 n=1 Tax=Anaeramoeba flamelloides TaxID=1746091 RepID=A0ABQ8ZCU9_9EUKA|nr:wd repeat-containing protein pop1 [Anaeramoeba flamelloides]
MENLIELSEIEPNYQKQKTNLPTCNNPLHVLGVQKQTPIAWEVNGNCFAFVTGNFSIYLIGREEKRKNKKLKIRFPLIATLRGHQKPIRALLFHPTKPLLVSAGEEGIFIWDLDDLELVGSLCKTTSNNSHNGKVQCLEWLLDGKYLISGSADRKLKVWDFVSENSFDCLTTIDAHKTEILVLSFCRQNSILASSGIDSVIKLWDLNLFLTELKKNENNNKNQNQNKTKNKSINISLINQTDQGQDQDLLLTFRQLEILEGHKGDITSLTWSSDGKTLWSGARDNQVIKWDIENKQSVEHLRNHKGDLKKIVMIGKDGRKLITASAYGYVKIWDVNDVQLPNSDSKEEAKSDENDQQLEYSYQIDNNELKEMLYGKSVVAKTSKQTSPTNSAFSLITNTYAHEEGLFAMENCPTLPLFATSSRNNSVKIWLVTKVLEITLLHEFVGHSDIINSVLLNEDEDTGINEKANKSAIFTCSADYSVHKYNARTMKREFTIDTGSSVNCMSVNAMANLIIVGGKNYILHGIALEQNSFILGKEKSSQGNLLIGREIVRFVGHCGQINDLQISPSQNMVVSTGNDFQIRTWPLKKQYRPKILSYHGFESNRQIDTLVESIEQFKLTKDQYLLPEIVKTKNRYSKHQGNVTRVVFHKRGTFLVSTGTDHKINIWKVKENSAKLIHMAKLDEAHSGVITGACWCSKVKKEILFATSSWDRTIKLWNYNKRKKKVTLEKTLNFHLDKVNDIDSTKDYRFLLSCSSDLTVRCFELNKPYNCIAVYNVKQFGYISSISAGSSLFVTGSQTGMVRIWPLYVDKFKEKFKNAIGKFELYASESQLNKSKKVNKDNN